MVDRKHLQPDSVSKSSSRLGMVVLLVATAAAVVVLVRALPGGETPSQVQEEVQQTTPESSLAFDTPPSRPPSFLPAPVAPEPAEAAESAKPAAAPEPAKVPSPIDARPAEVFTPGDGHEHVSLENPVQKLRDFDPDLLAAIQMNRGDTQRISFLSYAEPVRACATALLERHGYRAWVMGGIAQFRASIENQELRFTEADIIDSRVTTDRPPDDEFRDCFRSAVRRVRIACPNCRDGTLDFRWTLRPWPYKVDRNNLNGKVDPSTADPGFSLAPAPNPTP